MALLYGAPPLFAVAGHGVSRALGASAWAIMAFCFQPTLRRYGQSPLWGLALPLISMFYLGATIDSAVRHHCGIGGGWKNRVYPQGRDSTQKATNNQSR